MRNLGKSQEKHGKIPAKDDQIIRECYHLLTENCIGNAHIQQLTIETSLNLVVYYDKA